MPALISSALVLGENNSEDSPLAMGSGGGDPDAVTQTEVNGAAGFVVVISALTMLAESTGIVVRFCNIGLINLKCKTLTPIVSYVELHNVAHMHGITIIMLTVINRVNWVKEIHHVASRHAS